MTWPTAYTHFWPSSRSPLSSLLPAVNVKIQYYVEQKPLKSANK
jgi:hypothetical protein